MRRARRTREPSPGVPGPSNGMEVDSDSDSDAQVSVSQVSKSMKRINVTRGKTRRTQIDSDSDEEPQVSRNTQRMNGTHKGPKGRQNGARKMDSDSDEEPQPSTSQATQKKRRNNESQSQRPHHAMSQPSTSRAANRTVDDDPPASQISPNTSLTEQEHNHHVANVVKFILYSDNQKKVPIEKSKISKAINCHNKSFKDIFKSAQEVLEKVFGYVMIGIEEEDRNDARTQSKNNKFQKFFLVNTVENVDVHENVDEETNLHYVLLFLCLCHIFMSGDKCTVESLKTFLHKLGIVMDQSSRHEQFGDAMDVALPEFVREKYITLKEVGGEKELTWGVRAIKEFKPRTVMEFVSEIYDKRPLENWPDEYELLQRKEREANERPNGQMNGDH